MAVLVSCASKAVASPAACSGMWRKSGGCGVATLCSATSFVRRGTEFEDTVAASFERCGFLLQRSGGPHDAGVDLVGQWRLAGSDEADDQPVAVHVAVQCKALDAHNHVGVATMREFIGALRGFVPDADVVEACAGVEECAGVGSGRREGGGGGGSDGSGGGGSGSGGGGGGSGSGGSGSTLGCVVSSTSFTREALRLHRRSTLPLVVACVTPRTGSITSFALNQAARRLLPNLDTAEVVAAPGSGVVLLWRGRLLNHPAVL